MLGLRRMKRALILVPVFLLTLLLWSLLCPSFAGLARPETFYALADGKYSLFFSRTAETALQFIPGAAVLSFAVIFVFIMRHGVKKPAGFLVFAGIFIFTAAVLEPVSVILHTRWFPAGEETEARLREETVRTPESGFIREYEPGRRILWLEAPQGGQNTAAETVQGFMAADLKKSGGMPRLSVPGTGVLRPEEGRLETRGEVFAVSGFDPEICSKTGAPAFLRALARDTERTHTILADALEASPADYAWIGGAFFFSAAALFFFCVLTDWKLLNVMLFALSLRGLYRIFPLLADGEPYIFLRKILPPVVPDAAAAALPALGFAAVLTVLGFTLLLPRYRRKNPGGAEA